MNNTHIHPTMRRALAGFCPVADSLAAHEAQQNREYLAELELERLEQEWRNDPRTANNLFDFEAVDMAVSALLRAMLKKELTGELVAELEIAVNVALLKLVAGEYAKKLATVEHYESMARRCE